MREKKFILISAFAFIILLSGCTQQPSGNQTPNPNNNQTSENEKTVEPDVTINNMSFSKDITVKVGQKVIWRNDENLDHTVTFSTLEVTSGPLRKGDVYEFTFDTPGVYEYVCDFHPMMKAKVIVE